MVQLQKISMKFKEILGEDCDRNSTGWDNPGMDKWAPKEYVDAFFENPAILQNTIQNLTNTL